MFTGLIRTTGTILRSEQRGDLVLTIAMWEPFELTMGASVACHGICLTVIRFTETEFDVSLSAETLARSNAGAWKVGTQINLEPSLRVGDELGGHLVSGHVDGLAEAVRKEISGDSLIWHFKAPTELMMFIASKGSITLNGVSLTVNQVSGHQFMVNIIPHTLQVTTLGDLEIGERVNIEIDMLARYVARLKEFSA